MGAAAGSSASESSSRAITTNRTAVSSGTGDESEDMIPISHLYIIIKDRFLPDIRSQCCNAAFGFRLDQPGIGGILCHGKDLPVHPVLLGGKGNHRCTAGKILLCEPEQLGEPGAVRIVGEVAVPIDNGIGRKIVPGAEGALIVGKVTAYRLYFRRSS